MIFVVIEYSVLFLLMYFAVTQIILPSIKGTRLFPAFNKRRRSLHGQRREIKDEHELKELEENVEELRQTVAPEDVKPEVNETQTQPQT